ncbi:MAG TPA: hypothetical protein PLD05_08800, partial [Thermogutta sp.]|nr:hypothetical protein [Thermogutta sp.]
MIHLRLSNAYFSQKAAHTKAKRLAAKRTRQKPSPYSAKFTLSRLAPAKDRAPSPPRSTGY